jgi:hypothetical protein
LSWRIVNTDRHRRKQLCLEHRSNRGQHRG